VERMNILQPREGLQDRRELLIEGLFGVFDFSGVEGANTTDLESSTDLGGKSPLGSRQDDVEELLRRGDRGNILPGLKSTRLSIFIQVL